MPKLLFITLLFIFLNTVATANNSAGALIFKANCSQCHGALGLGDGYHPSLSELGNTHLIDITKDTSKKNLSAAISRQSLHQNMSEFKPIAASISLQLVNFLQFYFENPNKAFVLLKNTTVYKLPDYLVGKATYQRRCVICHGILDDGKVRLAKHIKESFPYDLRISHISDKTINLRSDISNFEFESVMLYVKTFRTDHFDQNINPQ